ncbi:Ribosomal protein S12 methylthiotransferase RimO [Acididesulfobacillus acetoxydans]|uniref:Ribosomal protein uS12 methylthiotransferase RimO n=1 Tax=Acididesulfobacillus acetoxydans TaxID=1561005 RepID=A0A8S0X6G2_9FIRM|nr:30S ribosomal protein S12 methylthiotransferase RimO [Acididesulfobacillus acetoxydans]CAA7602500.1 Ribosomal protein S12 methylthiotransferase RimO [Acididesulfobacillus acetoxydans]CEJ05955.1 Ribosomal protein S12 methylthiotransferase RimO [Acididesulfobacillus acetoxydans]
MTVKAAIVTLGCPKNQVDSEVMAGILGGEYELTDQPAEAEVILVNTCTFIDQAKEESIDTILEMARYKEEGRCKTLLACGCLAQRYKEKLMDEIPEIDGIFGTGGVAEVRQWVAEARRARGPFPREGRPVCRYPEDVGRRRSGPRHWAYVKVAEGCDNACTYCVIPQVRGPYRSRTEEAVLAEVRRLAAEGVKEVILVAQDTSRYGWDLCGELRLPVLIRKIAGVEGIRWIRLMYCYPDLVTDELIDTMRQEAKVCRYLDLPLQHASDKVLREMNRRGTCAGSKELIGKLRQALPDIRIRTTLITGFPGESEEEFEQLLHFVQETEFDRLGVFAYSREESTTAARRSDQVPPEIAEARRDRVMALQQEVALRRQGRWVGRTLRVLLEELLPDGRWLGRTEGDAPEIDGQVYVENKTTRCLCPGDFVAVKVLEADSYDLTGEVVL